ncbi:hypothetical protein L2E82_15525 [Cichorium intybus]|uniref:Uncharacterized protein n=1 Tax=Cichorium intybus TaxID=13427 RepID=A0ACB9F3G0_CICIN|nr:hypothetical protein L2E82_15525 [Cichorium intybus]
MKLPDNPFNQLKEMLLSGALMELLHNSCFNGSLAIDALLGPGRDLLSDGLKAFFKGSPNMNLFVGFGSIATFMISAISLLNPDLGWDAKFFDEPMRQKRPDSEPLIEDEFRGANEGSVYDATSCTDREQLLEKVSSVFNGKLNILINNVGTNIMKPALEYTAEEYSFLMATNLITATEINSRLIPKLKQLHTSLQAKTNEFSDIVKIGRTHTQDATPLTLGQEFSGYITQLKYGIERLICTLPRMYQLAQCGTNVGTGLNTKKGFDVKIAAAVADEKFRL